MLDITKTCEHDWLCWDGLETATYRSVRTSGTMVEYVVDAALRRAPTRRELAASNGVYQATDTVWLIPRVVLDGALSAEGQRPKPRDTITPSEGGEWTALEVAEEVDRTIYRFTTRNLVIHLDLFDAIDIERAGVVYNNAGIPDKQFPPEGGGRVLYSALPCRVQKDEERIADERLLRGEEVPYTIFLSRQVVIDAAEDRVKWTDGSTVRYLDIVRLVMPDRLDELPRLECVLRVA